LKSPTSGLEALLNVLKNNGLIKLALYSDLGRQDVVKAIEYISSKKLHPINKDIKAFRKKIISGKLPRIDDIKLRSDFYSISQCRDLCFHLQEHRFTIPQLKEIFDSYNLKFLGFTLPQSIKLLYANYFPEDEKQLNLHNWAKFEEKYPNTFTSMYQFWLSKN